jgi:RNA polymerase sigma-70 factor, ECF subfamily
MDDDQLLARVAGGDDVALRDLFRRHAPWLAVRLRAVLPAADVEDVLQETFLGVWRGAKRYRPEGAAGGWLWGIARRQAALHIRQRGPALVELSAYALQTDAGSDPAAVAQARVDLGAALAALGPEGNPERHAVQLLYVEDRPVAEVAMLMGVPAGTVKSRAHRARRLLRAALSDRPSGPAAGLGPSGGGTG